MARRQLKSKRAASARTAYQTLRLPLAFLGAAILLCGGGMLLQYWLSAPRLNDLEPLYALGRDLRRGQSRHEVMALVDRHTSPQIERSTSGEGSLRLIVSYAFARRCVLELTFDQNRLGSARTSRGGGTDPCPGAPPPAF